MSKYTGAVVKQWACDTIFKETKASKDVLTVFQAFAVLIGGK